MRLGRVTRNMAQLNNHRYGSVYRNSKQA